MNKTPAVRMLLVCIALLMGMVIATIAAALPQKAWTGRVKAGAATFAVAVPLVLATMSAAGLL